MPEVIDPDRAVQQIPVDEAEKLIQGGGAAVVDFATSLEYRAGHIPGAWFAVRSRLKECMARIPAASTLVMTSPEGVLAEYAAQDAAQDAEAPGDMAVKVIDGGTDAWRAAGYDLASPQGIEATIAEFDELVGVENLVAVHANDSKVEFGSGVDRHENIGEGSIGIDGFEVIMGHSAFREVPFILEVPGPDKKGPDKGNLDRLKGIRSRLGLAP